MNFLLNVIWVVLCLLASITAFAACTGLLGMLPPFLLLAGLLALGIVGLCVVVAGLHDSRPGFGR